MAQLEHENEELKSTTGTQHFRETLQRLKQKVEHLEEDLETSQSKCRTQKDTLFQVEQEKQLAVATADDAQCDLRQSMAVMKARMRELQFERDELLSIHNADGGTIDFHSLIGGDSKANGSHFVDLDI
jgi:predicted  nucleic acid-binding Zn-ribbon protein